MRPSTQVGAADTSCPGCLHRNLNLLGRYGFTASQPVKGLRPLRDPDATDLDDDDDDQEERARRIRHAGRLVVLREDRRRAAG
ncbi:hypothetical protein [Streptomyces sp. NPDC050988]|uniref:hypothetical protein n=1 Tax=Streptomyces sp. NPDC050988 TaxID=3365637 RepID=UPI0037B6C490